MSVDRPDETEAELVDRRMEEARVRWRERDARVQARRDSGIKDMPCAILWEDMLEYMPRRGPGWGS